MIKYTDKRTEMTGKRNNSNLRRKALAGVTAFMTAVVMCAVPSIAFASGGSVIEKDETVYVVTDSEGNQNEVIVSDHLKNDMKVDTIKDRTDLTDIENVKGDESFDKKNSDFTWYADGNDIYYQGSTTKKVPLTMDITYKLDGKVVTGQELQGKSGKVEIKIRYQNNVVSAGRTVPFIVMTGLIVTDGSFTDIEIDNGKVIDDGDKQIVAGISAPGLSDSFNLDSSSLDIVGESSLLDDTITIKGTADKFAVKDMMTIALNSVFDDIDTSNLEDMDYDDQISELNKGSKQLVSGTKELASSLQTLSSSAPTLNSGVTTVNKGMKDMYKKIKGDGTTENPGLSNSLNAIKGALTLFSAGIESAIDKTTGELNDAEDALKGNLDTASSQVSDVKESVSDVKGSITSASDDISDANDAIDEAISKLEESEDPEAEEIIDSLNTAKESLDDSDSDMSEAKSHVSDVKDDADDAKAKIKTAGGSVETALTKIATAKAYLDTKYNPDGSTAGIKQTVTGTVDKVNTSLDSLKNGVNKLQTAFEYVSVGSPGVLKAMDQINEATQSLEEGAAKLSTGSVKLSNGMSKLYNDGIKKIVSLYNDDLKGLSQDLSDAVDASKSYKTFTKLGTGMDGNVKFIYKIAISE